MQRERAVVMDKQWAAILAAFFITSVTATISYAWSANSQIAVLQSDVNELKAAKLDIRLARMEEKIDWLVQAQNKVRK